MDLCDFARGFPGLVEQLLDREQRLSGRRTFREETVTDLLTASLMAFRRAGIIADYPDETKTGADMEWTFVSISPRRRFTVLVQAKRLRQGTSGWGGAKYDHLLHKVSSKSKPAQRQINVLCSQATPRRAVIYAFYNPGTAKAHHTGMDGVMLSDAFAVQRLVRRWDARRQAKMKKSPSPPKNPRLASTLRPLMQPFSPLFCPGTQPAWIEIADGMHFLSSPPLIGPTPANVANSPGSSWASVRSKMMRMAQPRPRIKLKRFRRESFRRCSRALGAINRSRPGRPDCCS